jgi:hypothetical protein
VDGLYQLVRKTEATVHLFEFLAQWHSREKRRITRRAMSITLMPKYGKRDVDPVVVLLTNKRVPAKLQRRFRYKRGRSGGWVEPIYVRVYELDPWVAINLGDRKILPLVPLMREDPAALAWAAEIVAADPVLGAQFVILGSLKYDKDWLRQLLRRYNVSLWWAPELLAKTPAGQDIIEQSRPDIESRARAEGMEKGRVEGMEKGREEGREEATLAHIRKLLQRRYPSLADAEEIRAIMTFEQAEAVMDALLDAQDEPAARAALSAKPAQ